MEKLIGKLYLKADKTVSFDIVEYKQIKYVVIGNIPMDLDFLNLKYFDIYYDI